MAINRVKGFLDEHAIDYIIIKHIPAYTAQGIAAISHISGKKVVKTVIIKSENKLFMVVLPASSKIDFDRLGMALGGREVELVKEEELENIFPDCEKGAMPPFGNLYDMEVLTDASLKKDEEIAFNAGTHRELIKMAYQDYDKWVHPRVANFSHRF